MTKTSGGERDPVVEVRDGRIWLGYELPTSFDERQWIAAYGDDDWREMMRESLQTELPRLMAENRETVPEAYGRIMWPEWAQMLLIERLLQPHIEWFEIDTDNLVRGVDATLTFKTMPSPKTAATWAALLETVRALDAERAQVAAQKFFAALSTDPAWQP